ncbi:MAG: TetR/AcrR family transcriptional regulator [Thermonemataceae bacterium]
MTKEEKIIHTSIRLFNENGFHGTATSKIAKEAGVANGTLFQYFPTKENLILASFISIKEEMKQHLLNNLSDTSNTKQLMKAHIVLSLTWAVDNPTKFAFLQQFHSSPYLYKLDSARLAEYNKPHLRIIQQAIDEKLIKPLSVDLIYALISSHTYGLYQFISLQKHTKKEQAESIEKGFELLWKMLN